MTLLELYNELERHDWFHMMSDDHSVWKRGAADASRLVAIAPTIPGGADLLVAYQQHMFSGEPWKTEKAPKPERPTA